MRSIRVRCHRWLQRRAFSHQSKFRYIISSFDHLTSAQRKPYLAHVRAKDSRPPRLVLQEPPAPQFLRPVHYHPGSSTWVALEGNNGQSLERSSVLKIISWNINASTANHGARVTAALEHLQELFGKSQDPIVMMFQEVCDTSLQAILQNPWVQQNFVLSDTRPPESIYTNIPGDSFILRRLDWAAAESFSLLMISRNLAIETCFRVPFKTLRGRDALVVDIPISSSTQPNESNECLRLCTTHLESFMRGKTYRYNQLALISTLLKGVPIIKSRIVAGIVGGDINSIEQSEQDFHRAIDVDLKDAWEDVPAPPIPVRKPFQKGLSYGRARGNTWGYQPVKSRPRNRMDKFLYTGSLETVAPEEAQDVTGRLGRLGIGLKIKVDAWEGQIMKSSVVPGKIVKKPVMTFFTRRSAVKWQEKGLLREKKLVRKKGHLWVSDHFGIAIGIKVH